MNLRKLRDKRGMTQEQFWTRIGLTQSGGSRYESENRNLPEHVAYLVTIAHGDEKDAKETIKKLRQ